VRSGGQRKLIAPLTIVLALVALGAQPALAAPGGTDRPYKASGTATTTFTVVPAFVIDGTANVTHLGLSRSHSEGVLTGPNTSAYTTTLVAANGDTLTFSSVSSSTQESATTFALFSTDTITGGTGRFAGAKGQDTSTGTATLVSVNPVVFHDTFTSSGTISY
jgi:hypothetical protein